MPPPDPAAPPEAGRITRAEQRERSRSAILTTATALFAERGFAGVSLDELAEAAGVRRTLVLYYFRSKDALWRCAAAEVATAFNAALVANLAKVKSGSDEDRLHATMRASLDTFLEQPDFPRFLVREGGVDSPRLQWLVEHFSYAKVEYGSEQVREYIGSTILRDVMFAVLLSMAALGPLMEASLSQVAGRRRSGVHPMSRANRAELAALMTRLLVSVGVDRAEKS